MSKRSREAEIRESRRGILLSILLNPKRLQNQKLSIDTFLGESHFADKHTEKVFLRESSSITFQESKLEGPIARVDVACCSEGSRALSSNGLCTSPNAVGTHDQSHFRFKGNETQSYRLKIKLIITIREVFSDHMVYHLSRGPGPTRTLRRKVPPYSKLLTHLLAQRSSHLLNVSGNACTLLWYMVNALRVGVPVQEQFTLAAEIPPKEDHFGGGTNSLLFEFTNPDAARCLCHLIGLSRCRRACTNPPS